MTTPGVTRPLTPFDMAREREWELMDSVLKTARDFASAREKHQAGIATEMQFETELRRVARLYDEACRETNRRLMEALNAQE